MTDPFVVEGPKWGNGRQTKKRMAEASKKLAHNENLKVYLVYLLHRVPTTAFDADTDVSYNLSVRSKLFCAMT